MENGTPAELTRMGETGTAVAETNTAAAAAAAQAMVLAKFMRADKRPRSMAQVRNRILEDCARPGFAESARYAVPRGNGFIRGWSIRFAEAIVRHMGNITTMARIVHDDDHKRIIDVEVIDLETNTSHNIQSVLEKTAEQRTLKDGQVAISERVNSTGQVVYLVAAREDQLTMKQGAIVSKALRTCGLRLVPQDVLDECLEIVNRPPEGQTLNDRIRVTCDRFAKGGIPIAALEKHLGHAMDDCTAEELADLWGTFQAIRDGETTWATVADQGGTKQASEGTLNLDSLTGAGEDGEPKPADPKPAPKAPADPKPAAKAPAKSAKPSGGKRGKRGKKGAQKPPPSAPREPGDEPTDAIQHGLDREQGQADAAADGDPFSLE